jgi:site-specific DNA-cytosine methylase
MILEKFGHPDVIWIAPDCRTYSIAAISHHRRKNPDTGYLEPISEYAKKCDRVNWHIMNLIKELNPKVFYIENPRSAYRKMPWIQNIPRYTITHCQYSLDLPPDKRRAKPTDIFTNHPNPKFRRPCKNGSPCHVAAPRGSKTGTQGLKNATERAMYPKAFCEHIVTISEEVVND